MLCQLAGGSPHLADQLANEPHIFDDFVDALLTGVRGTQGRRQLLDALGQQDADPWLQLSDHRKLETLRIGVRDLSDLATTRQTLAELSHLCIDILRNGFDLVMAHAMHEHGQPFTIRGMSAREAVGMAVVALGKVGGLEASYASDADLIFVYGADGETESGLSNREFFTKVAEDFIAHIAGSRGNPRLYKVDTRLRPEGSKGTLVTHMRALEAYYQSPRAALFEFQSLLKARVVAGDAGLGQTLLARIRRLVRGHDYGDDFAQSFRAMREKIEATAHGLDLKRGTGGMVDIEFLTQFLQLRHGRDVPAILVPETPRALEIIAEHDLLRPHVAHWLRDTYFFFRRVETRLQIAMGLDTKEIPSDPTAARSLAMRLGYADTADGDAAHLLRVDLEEAAAETRTWFNKLLV
jgi:glutamate-ammonia-ligase adenylyltransferase